MECVRNHKCTAGRPVRPDRGGVLFVLWVLEHNKLWIVIQSWNLLFQFSYEEKKKIPLCFDARFNLWPRSLIIWNLNTQFSIVFYSWTQKVQDLAEARSDAASRLSFKILTVLQSIAACVGEPRQNAGAEKQNAPALLLFSAVYHRHIILFRYDIHHLSSSLHVFQSKPPYHLLASGYNLPISQRPVPPSCIIIAHSANHRPPPKWWWCWWWWGTEQEVKGDLKSCSHPQAHLTPPHPALPGCSVALCPGSCPGFGAVMGRVTVCVWPRACMLDVVIISSPPPTPLGRQSPMQEELPGSGEALDLENSCAG